MKHVPRKHAILSPSWPLRFWCGYPDASRAANGNISCPYFQRQPLVGLRRQSINSISLTLNVDWVVSNLSCPARANLWVLFMNSGGKKCPLTFFKGFLKIFCMHTRVCAHTCTWMYMCTCIQWLRRPEEGIGFQATWVTSSYESPGFGSKTWVLWEGKKHS